MIFEWLKNKSKQFFYPITHADGVLCGSNADKTLTQVLIEKSNTGHTHDDRYYTESEMNSKLSAKFDSAKIIYSTTQPTVVEGAIWLKPIE